MAVLADVRGIYVRRILTGSIDAIVATEAISGDVVMIENSRHPERARVAIVAPFARDDVAGRLAGRLYPIVTSTTAAGHRSVVHVVDRAPGRCCMAGIADCR